MTGGIIGALAAAIPGYIDYRSLHRSGDRARRPDAHGHQCRADRLLYTINAGLRILNGPEALLPVFSRCWGRRARRLGVAGRRTRLRPRSRRPAGTENPPSKATSGIMNNAQPVDQY